MCSEIHIILLGKLLMQVNGLCDEAHTLTWLVHHVVDPPPGLLHTQLPPLCLTHQTALGHSNSNMLGQNHMSSERAGDTEKGHTCNTLQLN